ncbi:hypothetical protein SDC9_171603 [bioreactor metagenome]|uniref:Uncharacterized protein n=1 Tax=bioreactor metagenome TaxID=1076179 RepID=A0A645GEK5_9ZZZZ
MIAKFQGILQFSGGSRRQPGNQYGFLSFRLHSSRYTRYLPRGFAGAIDYLRHTLPQLPMVVKLGIAQILKRLHAQLQQALLRRYPPRFHFF